MKFVIVKPRMKAAEAGDFADLDDALRRGAGLKPARVEHRVVHPRSLMIAVYEYALFVSPDAQSYFRIDASLYGGPAVLYRIGSDGVTTDLVTLPTITWFNNPAEVAIAIQNKRLQQPTLESAGGKVLWEWPRPRREFMEKIKS